MAKVMLPKRWSRARRRATRAVIRYDVMKMLAIDRYTDTLFRVQAACREEFNRVCAEMFLAVARDDD